MNHDWKRGVLFALMVMAAVAPMAGGALASQDTRQASLSVDQERWVSEPVNVETSNGTRTYVARGQYLEITPENFNSSDVTAFSVREDEGVITYDRQIGRYILNTQQNAGTYHIRWTVSQHNQSAIYTAAVRVIQADYQHIRQSDYNHLQNASTRGQEIISSIENSGDPDTPVEQKVEFGNTVRDFKNNPFSAFTGQFMALQTIRFLTPAGWVDLGVTVVVVYALTRGLYGTIARLRKQLENEEQVARREDIQYIKMFKQVLSGKQLTDVDAIDDHQAAVLEDRLGPNMFTALRNFWSVWGAQNLKRMYADAMGDVGYRAIVTRSDAGNVRSVEVISPDGSEPMTDGGVSGNGTEPGDGEVGKPLSKVSESALDALEWEDVDERVFQDNPDISAVDHLMVTNRESDEDLISELQVSIPEDFQSRQEFMEVIGHFIQEVMESDFVDEEGKPREDRTVLNHLHVFSTVMADEYNVPLDLWWRACVWNAEGLDRDDEARDVLSDITDAGEALDDVDISGGDSVGS